MFVIYGIPIPFTYIVWINLSIFIQPSIKEFYLFQYFCLVCYNSPIIKCYLLDSFFNKFKFFQVTEFFCWLLKFMINSFKEPILRQVLNSTPQLPPVWVLPHVGMKVCLKATTMNHPQKSLHRGSINQIVLTW